MQSTPIDPTLTKQGEAADAAVVGDRLEPVKELTGNPSRYATFIQGGHEAGVVFPEWKYRIVSEDIIHIVSNTIVKIAEGRRLSVHYFDAQGNFLRDSGWIKNDYNIPENSYIRMCISAFPATVSAEYSYVADVDTLLSYVRLNAVTDRLDRIEQCEAVTRVVEFKSTDFKQGSIYYGSDDGSIKTCVSTKNFFVLYDASFPIEIETKADNGYKWKVRINFYDKDRKYISQVGYDYLTIVPCPSNAAFYRLSVSLIGEDGTDLECTPNDVVDGYIKTVQHCSGTALLDKYFEDVVVEQEKPKVYAYGGKKIEIGTHDVRYEHYMDLDSFTSSLGTQGSAVYGNYLFVGHATMSYINILDLSTKSYVGNIAFEPVDAYHCNNMNFGVEKYAESDVFPLLYISQENINEHKCIVMRITESDGVFSGEVVQTITYPEPSSVSMYFPNCVIDTDNNYIYVIGYKINGYATKENNALKVAKWELPKLADGDVMLDMSAAKDSFEMPFVSCTQGAIVHNGRIFQCYGVDWKTHGLYLCMINPDAHTVETKICLNDIGYYPEPEALFVWNNYLYMVPHQGSIVKFYF